MDNNWVWNGKVALITGIGGQDGSYLSEFLLSKGYKVRGIIRRASFPNTKRIDHLDIYDEVYGKGKDSPFYLLYGDMADSTSIRNILESVNPNEVYNLAAQSHVGISFQCPESTMNFNALGPLRILEAIKDLKLDCKYYQASSSEMFGITPPPQNEETRMMPQSPYGIAKLAGYHLTRLYRNAYGVFACNGILFNHETITSFMPMFVKKVVEEEFDIKPIGEIVGFDEGKNCYQEKDVEGIQILGKGGWVDVSHASAYPHDLKNDNKKPRFVNSRSGAFMATSSHIAFMKDGEEKEIGKIEVGDKIEVIEFPKQENYVSNISTEEAELMGLMVGDGSISYVKNSTSVKGKFTNSSEEIREKFDSLWRKVTGGQTLYYPSKSGFDKGKIVGQLGLSGGNDWLRNLDIYNKDKKKRVPKVILNSSKEIMTAFLRGYNLADGLKQNSCTYEFRNFKTNSATLALGLWYLIDMTTKQDINLSLEIKDDGRLFYSMNILSDIDNKDKEEKVKEMVALGNSQRGICRDSGISRTFIRKIQNGGEACAVHHLKKDAMEVKKIIDMPSYEGWFYDLTTSSGEFHCGVGKCHVHNSPRRGLNFVTRKITLCIADILIGGRDKIRLGNLEAKRDWGFSKEYVEAMWLIMQHEKPDDFVIATKETHTVREFLEVAFDLFGLDYKDFIEIDNQFKRPAEVPALLGDATKAGKILNWEPKTKFKELVRLMLASDLREKMKERGLIAMNENFSDDEILDKGKELAFRLSKKKSAERVDELFRGLDKLDGEFSSEIIDNIKRQLKNGENKLE